MRRLALLGLCTLALPSCTLLDGYPPVTIENTPELCHNHGIDDDFDGVADCMDIHCRPFCGEGTRELCRNGIDDDGSGQADCADPSCAGLCAEETPAACSDHADQDGDGLVDLDDPSCWPEALTSIERCVDDEGGEWTASLRTEGDGWLAYGGDAHYVADPEGRFPGNVLSIPDPAPAGSASGVRNATTVTGAIDDLTLRASVYLPGGTTEVFVRIEASTTPPAGAPAEIDVSLGSGSIGITYIVDGTVHGNTTAATHPRGWYTLTLDISGTHMSLGVVPANGDPMSTLDLMEIVPLVSQAPMRFSISQFNEGGALLGAAYLRRGSSHPCGDTVFVPPVDETQGALSFVLLTAVSDGDALCVLGQTGRNAMQAFRSDDGGRTFGPGVDIALRGPDDAGHCASLAWDPERALFAGLATLETVDHTVTATLLTSPDCRSWQTEDAPALASSAIACSTYSIVPAVDAASDATHELWKLLVAGHGVSLQRHWSPTPFAPDVAPSSDPVRRVGSAATPNYSLPEALAVHAFGGDLLVAVRFDSATHVLVVDREVPELRDWATFAPSHIDGTCDATTLQYPRLYFSAPARGGLAHSCGSDTLVGGPTVVRTFAIAAHP